MMRPGYRVYREPVKTYMFFKGHNLEQINQFARFIRQQRAYKDDRYTSVGVVQSF